MVLLAMMPMHAALGEFPDGNAHPPTQSHSVVGCNATGCHGSNVPDSKNWQRAFKIWFDQDPHSRAYTALLSESSVQIVSRLADEELKPTSPKYLEILNTKCVSCHANAKAPEAERVLGVDCQLCHGDAEAWGSEHYSSKWKMLGTRRFENTQMINMESVVSRAKTCCSCHIGELNRTEDAVAIPDREVDHRMMAAGHPPMHFDFESYLRRYPAHWDWGDEKIGVGSSTGVQRWRIGKLTATVARLNLLAARAQRAAIKQKTINDWPEFTEYSCTSCHHSLEEPNRRPSRSIHSLASWDDWAVSQLDCAVRDASRDPLQSQLTTLKNQVEMRLPDPKKVASSASALQRWLALELNHVSGTAEQSPAVLLPKLQSRLAPIEQIQNWESATQWYIATRVLAEGLGLETSREPIPFFIENPYLGIDQVWKPSSFGEFDTPRRFHPEMLFNYSNDIQKQLRSRP